MDTRYATVEPWHKDRLCAQTDPDLWFPDKGGTSREAKRICAACEVQTECLEYALEHNEQHGIWGGVGERERRRIRLDRRRGTVVALTGRADAATTRAAAA